LYYKELFINDNEIEEEFKCYDVPILMYHGIGKCKADYSCVSRENFVQHLDFLISNGYNFITPDKLAKAFDGKMDLPEKPIMITFDDGHENFYTKALPIIKEKEIPVTLFMIAGSIDKEAYLSTRQLEDVLESKLVTIGNHTWSHPKLPEISRDLVFRQIVDSQKEFFKKFGFVPKHIAYPNGDFNQAVKDVVDSLGFDLGFATSVNQITTQCNFSRYELGRIYINDVRFTKEFY
jgi:peptidoglycan/xylan/chitin deacetylase (PgdA/CDA1 family)